MIGSAACAAWPGPSCSRARRCWRPTTGRGARSEADARDHLAVGFAQAAALVPGVSRSGAALTAAPAARARPPGRAGALVARRAARDAGRGRAQGGADGGRPAGGRRAGRAGDRRRGGARVQPGRACGSCRCSKSAAGCGPWPPTESRSAARCCGARGGASGFPGSDLRLAMVHTPVAPPDARGTFRERTLGRLVEHVRALIPVDAVTFVTVDRLARHRRALGGLVRRRGAERGARPARQPAPRRPPARPGPHRDRARAPAAAAARGRLGGRARPARPRRSSRSGPSAHARCGTRIAARR